MNLKLLFFFGIFLMTFCSCGHPEDFDSDKIQKASIQVSKKVEQSEVSYYDFDKQGKRLTRKFIKVNGANPNKLEIAIRNFLTMTNFQGNYHHLNFNYTEFNADSATFYFKGKYDFERKADKEIFEKALELTISNYTDNTKINLVLNDNKF